MRRVILESPFRGPTVDETEANIAYAKRAVMDCLAREEAPIASHLLFTQPGILLDADADQRRQGIEAGHAWIRVADAVVVYLDRGISEGMRQGIQRAAAAGVPIEERVLD